MFLALNHDREVWVASYSDRGALPSQIVFRTHNMREPKQYIVHKLNGKRLLEDVTTEPAVWEDNWTIWINGYEFAPTHWMPLPAPPKDAAE